MASIVDKNNGQTVFTFTPNNGIPVELDLTGIYSIRVQCYGAGSLCGDNRTGSRGGYTSGILDTSLNKCFTILSSSEWNVITTNLPPTDNILSASFSAGSKTSSS